MFTIKSKWQVESLRYTMQELFDKFTQIMNTSITIACSKLQRNEMTNGSYKHHIIWEKEVWSKLPLVLICCYSLYHSLSLVVPLVVTHCPLRCHLLYKLLSLVTRCITRLFFYKRSVFSYETRFLNQMKDFKCETRFIDIDLNM